MHSYIKYFIEENNIIYTHIEMHFQNEKMLYNSNNTNTKY